MTPADLAESIGLPDEQARAAAHARQATLTKPPGALGRLEDVAAWLCAVQAACPPRPLDNVRVIVVAGDHGVAARTSAFPPAVTAQMVLNFVAGGAAVNVLADVAGATVRVVDAGVDVDPSFYGTHAQELTAYRVRRGTGAIDVEDAMSREEALAAFTSGVALVDVEVDSGADLLIVGDMGIGNTTPASAIIALLAGLDPASAVGRGTGIDDRTWMRKCAAVRDAMRRGRPHKGDPIGLLAAIGGPDLAMMAGILMGAAARRTPVLLDGIASLSAALVAHRAAFRARDWWLASHRSTEPAAQAALERLGLEPLVDLGLRLGEGTGALVALPLVRAAAATLTGMSTFEDAGVDDGPG